MAKCYGISSVNMLAEIIMEWASLKTRLKQFRFIEVLFILKSS